MCRSVRQGWRWLPAPFSSNPGRRLGRSGSLQGEDNFACNFMSQSINSHCGGRRKVYEFYVHFDVLQWDGILKIEGFFKLFLLYLILSCHSCFLTFPAFCEASSITPLSWDPKHTLVSDVVPGVAFGLFPYLSQGMLQWVCSSSRGKESWLPR